MAQIVPTNARPPELRLQSLNGGMSLKYDPTQLTDTQSPYMVNMVADDQGTLGKRDGQEYVYPASLGATGINGMYGRLFGGAKVFAWGTSIYKQLGSSAPVTLMGGLSNSKGNFFSFGGKLYYLNGVDYAVIDGTLSPSMVTPYTPTVLISTRPAGDGTPNEQINLLTPTFKVSFSSDGAATKYYLPFTGLDAASVTITVNGVAKTEGTHFTVNRTATPLAYVDFAAGSSPTGVIATSAPNNVIVTAAKTVSGNTARIKNCRYMIDFGGDNDTRVFLWGNSNFPNRVFRSGLLDPSYFPENEYSDVGTSSEAVVACAKHYDKLLYIKERSIAFTVYSNPVTQGLWGADQIGASFPIQWINGAVGCDMPGSVQVIDNNVVFGNSELGLFIVVAATTRDERNIRPISGNINGAFTRPGLLDETNADLKAASSVDDGTNYWLCVGNKAWCWNYRLAPFTNTGNTAADEERLAWFPHTNINAGCWMQNDRELYYGDRSTGRLVSFQPIANDFGEAINGVWRSKRFNFNLPDWLKTVMFIWFTAKAGGFSVFTVKYISENGETLIQEEINVSSFNWAEATWANWTWGTNQYPPPARLKARQKKVVYFTIEFSNNVVNQGLSLLSLVVQYTAVKKVK